SEDVSGFLAMTLSGYTVTQYRERDKLVDVDLRAPKRERIDPSKLAGLAIPTPHGPVPLGTIGHVRDTLEYGVIWERDRQPTVTVQADVRGEAPSIGVTRDIDAALATVRATLPAGYRIEIGGAAEESMKGQTSINAQMPLMIIAVLTLLMIQLKRFSRT
ncbi:efflux RND transporter permease subunit, partial [Alcaligenes phenolicus]